MIDAEIRTQLIEIEMMLAHQQKAIDELSEMVIKHGKVIDHLQKQTDMLQTALEEDIVKPLSEETPPPHY
ncbi:MAG: SlyX family protein [Alphaproteobacteria bacterium]|jgi:SlyX protein|nr:SlyX family protein [Alphaproteobacteria bacterium]